MGVYGAYRLHFVEKKHRTRKTARLPEELHARLFGIANTAENKIRRAERAELCPDLVRDCRGNHRLARSGRAIKQKAATVLSDVPLIQLRIFERKQHFTHYCLLDVG